MKQYTLGVQWRDEASFANFYPGDNAFVLDTLSHFLNKNSSQQGLFLWGPQHAGCSHLLQACCQSWQAGGAGYFPLSRPEMSPGMLDGIECLSLVCIDDMDQVLGEQQWEDQLFHTFNRLQRAGVLFIFSAHQSPRHLNCQLKDLQSRLFSLLQLAITPLTDDEKIKALQLRAANRGLTLSMEVASFLIHHYPRDMRHLMSALDCLDDASLVQKRHITIPLAKQVLGL